MQRPRHAPLVIAVVVFVIIQLATQYLYSTRWVADFALWIGTGAWRKKTDKVPALMELSFCWQETENMHTDQGDFRKWGILWVKQEKPVGAETSMSKGTSLIWKGRRWDDTSDREKSTKTMVPACRAKVKGERVWLEYRRQGQRRGMERNAKGHIV